MPRFLLTSLLLPLFASAQDLQCKKFTQIYNDGTELCENMWGGAFKVVDNYSEAYTMWFFDKVNPNDGISQGLHPTGDTSFCNLQFFHKGAPTPEGDNFTECHPWKEASCCNSNIAQAEALRTGYGPEFEWDRCGKLSPACERFFVQEGCFYECSPHIGLYRKWGGHACDEANDPGCSNTYNATCDPFSPSYIQGACINEHNTWQVHQMPIRKDYCDSWLTACANDFFCAANNGDYFSCATSPPTLAPTPTPEPEKEKEEKLSRELIAVIVVLGVLLVASAAFLCVVYKKEKDGKPMFQPLNEGKSDKKKLYGLYGNNGKCCECTKGPSDLRQNLSS